MCSYVVKFSEPLGLGLKGLIVIRKHKKSVSCYSGVKMRMGMKPK